VSSQSSQFSHSSAGNLAGFRGTSSTPVCPGYRRLVDVATERENEEWPQRRALAMWTHPDPGADTGLWLSDGFPLRVSIAGLGPTTQLLVLLEVKRFGRLYLVARPVQVTSAINTETEINTDNCFLTAMLPPDMAPQLDVLKEFRDEVLMASVGGRKIVDYYYAVSPRLIDAARGHQFIAKATQFIVNLMAPLIANA
jgi:hypothetical protein